MEEYHGKHFGAANCEAAIEHGMFFLFEKQQLT
jgi:hypothetical protein